MQTQSYINGTAYEAVVRSGGLIVAINPVDDPPETIDPYTGAPAGYDGDDPAGMDFEDDADRVIADSLVDDTPPVLVPMPKAVHAPRWLWRGWIPTGHLSLLAASGGTGKGTLWAYLVACVTNGREWPDGTTTEPGRVAILSPDDAMEDTLSPRLLHSGADRDRVWTPRSDPIDAAHGRTPLEKLLSISGEDARGMRLIIVDMMAAGLSSVQSSNSADDVSGHLDRFRELAQRTGAAVLAVHHVGKWSGMKVKDGARLADVVRGSGAWVDKSRVVMMLFPDRQDDQHHSRLLIRAKSNIGAANIRVGAYRVFGRAEHYPDDRDGAPGETFVVSRTAYEPGDVDDLFEKANERPFTIDTSTAGGQAGAAIFAEVAPGAAMLKQDVVTALLGQGHTKNTIDRSAKKLESEGLLVIRKRQPGEFPGANNNAVVWERP